MGPALQNSRFGFGHGLLERRVIDVGSRLQRDRLRLRLDAAAGVGVAFRQSRPELTGPREGDCAPHRDGTLSSATHLAGIAYVITFSQAPWGSAITAKRPTLGMSVGGCSTLPPSAVT